MSEENKRLVREITDVIWNRRGLDRSPEFYATDFVGDYRPYALREGHEGIRAMVKGAWTAFPDYHEEIHDLIAEGDRIVLSQCRTSRTQRRSCLLQQVKVRRVTSVVRHLRRAVRRRR